MYSQKVVDHSWATTPLPVKEVNVMLAKNLSLPTENP